MYRALVFLSLIFTILAIVPSEGFAQPVCVTSARAPMRKGPGTQFPVTWSVGQNMPLLKISQKGGWVQVQDVDGDTHWISASSVSARNSCVVVKARSAPLRSGPGSNHPLSEITFADRYTPFKKVDRDGPWIKLQDDYKGTYWVYETNVWIPVMKARISF
jgi:SH3-like domain-containing protein